jgi:hypothetical protein
MSYTDEITRTLIETLSKTAGLPTFQLAGHVPNLAFWMAETVHALAVIDGYPKRFDDMVAAQNDFDANYPDAAKRREYHEYHYKPLRPVLTPGQADQLSRKLVSVANRLIDRCLTEELIDIVKADDLRATLTADRSPTR